MALINYNDYFDFDGYKAAIKELTEANKAFGASTTGYIKGISGALNESKAELQQYATTFKEFNVNSKNAGATLQTMSTEVDKVTERFRNQRAAIDLLTDVQDLNTRSVNELKAAAKGLQAQYNELAGASANVQAKKQVLAQEFRRVTEAANMQSAALKVTKKEIDAAAGSYDALSNELKDIDRALKSMSNAFDPLTGKINSQNTAALALQKRYVELNGTLKNIDAGLGNFKRSIGDYKTGFNGLGNSINQITREFPSFANSVQTGFLAISNNLPIFFDELKRTSDGIKALKEEGKPAPSLFKALASSVLSFGTVLSLGVTLLTIYGKDIVNFVEKVFEGAKKIDTASEIYKNANAVYKEGNKEAGKQIATLKALYSATQDVTLSEQTRVAAAKELQKEYPETFKNISTENILLGQAKTGYDELAASIIKVARAKAAQSKIDEIEAKLLDADILRTKILKAGFNQKLRVKGSSTDQVFGGSTLGSSGNNGVTLSEKDRKDRIDAITNANLKSLRESTDSLVAQRDALIGMVGQENIVKAIIGKPEKVKDETDKLLHDYERALREREAVLKKNLDEEITLQQGRRDRDEISEVEFQDKKFQASENYAKLATAEETAQNKVGYKAKESLLKEFQNVRQKAEEEFNTAIVKVGTEHEKEVLEQRKKALIDLATIETNALKENQELALSNQRLTNEERVKLEIDYQNQLDQIQIDSLNARAALEVDYEKKRTLQGQAASLGAGIDKRNNFGAKVSIPRAIGADTIKALQEELAARQQLGIATIEEEISVAVQIREIHFKLNQDTAEDDKKLAALRKKLQDETVSYIRASAAAAGIILGQGFTSVFDEILKGFEKVKNGGKLTYEDLARFGIASSNAITETYKAGIDQQLADLEVRKAAELKLAGNNASAQMAINAKFDREQKALNRKKAKADRENAVFQIAINTAQAIAKSIAESPLTFGLPFSAFALAAGALQTALVLSKPLPQFAGGTDNAPAGLAIVDEIGSELIVDRHGRIKEVGTEDGPRVTRLDAGDKVKTAMETKRLLRGMETDKIFKEFQLNARLSSSLSERRQAAEMVRLREAIKAGGINETALGALFERAVGKIPIHQTIFDEQGIKRRTKQGNTTTTFLNLYKMGKTK